MIGIYLHQVKGSFDASTILWPTNRFVKKLLHRFGGYVRNTQRNSMKRANDPPHGPRKRSKPGNPPLRHAANPDIKETVFYYVDPHRKDVIIGMVLLQTKSRVGEMPMPGVLEYGGEALIYSGRWNRRTGHAGRTVKVVKVLPRPSAVPAFEKAVKKYLPDLIREGIMPHAKTPTIAPTGQVF